VLALGEVLPLFVELQADTQNDDGGHGAQTPSRLRT